MLPAMARKPLVTIVGPGRLGTALTLALHHAAYHVDEIVVRRGGRRSSALARSVKATLTSFSDAKFHSGLVWICVPDNAIRKTANQFAAAADWAGKYVFHSSGALASDELSELRKRGAAVASVHPMMSFVHDATPELGGVSFALEGDAAAVRLARRVVKDLSGIAISISARRKPLYHAFGAFASPMLISTLATAEQVGMAAGLSRGAARKAMLPIVTQTLRNYAEHGAPGAFSGPIIRGDLDTVGKNLASLSTIPEAQDAYLALARAALRYLPAGNRKKLAQILATNKMR